MRSEDHEEWQPSIILRRMVMTRMHCTKTMNKKESSDKTLGELPDDIIRQIFLRLPLENLRHCNCVSKAWRSIICAPRFQQDYRVCNRLDIGLLVSIRDATGQDFCYSPLRFRDPDAEQFYSRFNLPCKQITQVVKGLVCFYNQDRLRVFNIHTGEVVALPRNEYCWRFFFGYDPVDGVYKVIGVSPSHDYLLSQRTKCEILTLGQDSDWRKLPDVRAPLFFSFTFNWELSLANGFIYWNCWNDVSCLFSFGLHEEKFRSINLPQGCHMPQNRCTWSFVQFRGRMALAENCSFGLKLHVLDDEKGNSWSWTEHNIPYPSELHQNYRLGHAIITVGNLPTGHLLLANPLVNSVYKGKAFTAVYAYDHQSSKFERFVVGEFPIILDLPAKVNCVFNICCLEENITQSRLNC